ncbi:RWD domain-containing protein 4 [Anabrus simplex]|uniref:RWD domain-containing protein 4 n=1 Tax=Anabrus simplex TaxID=316456 RepID=UPI0034DD2A73
MTNSQLQEEELEVLLSIYDGDPAFKQLLPTTFQYKYGEDGDSKSFLLEISWGSTYPTDKPSINMDTFYNKHIVPEVKAKIVSSISNEAEQYLGAAMTYTLFEYVKDKAEEFLATQPDSLVKDSGAALEHLTISNVQEHDLQPKKVVKKEQLSKAQKRKQWDRVDAKGDKPRGWDWVDVVKHLSQTGSKQPTSQDLPLLPCS